MGVVVRDDGAVRAVLLDRPRQFNALDPDLFRALDAALARAMADGGVRAVVLGGEGRAFCAGADVAVFAKALAEGSMAALLDDLLPVFQRTIRTLAEGPKPTVAAVQGPAAGAGLDLALACDLRVIGDRASLCVAYGRVGLVPDGGAPHHLTRLLGAARAAELCLLPDRVVSPEEAVCWGLALEAVPREQVLAKAIDVARRLAAGPATALSLTREMLRLDPARPLGEALDAEAAAQRRAVAHPDAAEGVRAAVERRPARFLGAPAADPANATRPSVSDGSGTAPHAGGPP
jgi:2-(1,2-epoxy-1,2-dihydrophenyl)acetyl-CoA isomerase